MISDWFKNKKDYPKFWNDYLATFQNEKKSIKELHFIAFDTETTGFNKHKDRILSIGAVTIKNNIIEVSETLELYLKQDVFTSKTVEIHGLLKNGSEDKISELEAIKTFLEYIRDAVLIGHHVDFDLDFVNRMLERHGLGTLINKKIDTGELFKKSKHLVYQGKNKNYTLDNLCEELHIEKQDRHTSVGDALITAIAFLKIIPKLKNNSVLLKMIK